jgi:hypothetical protein
VKGILSFRQQWTFTDGAIGDAIDHLGESRAAWRAQDTNPVQPPRR